MRASETSSLLNQGGGGGGGGGGEVTGAGGRAPLPPSTLARWLGSGGQTAVVSALVCLVLVLGVTTTRLTGSSAAGAADHNTPPASNWVVVTSIQYPTEDVKSMCAHAAKDPDLEMVVVADTKTPLDWHAEGCTFLSVAMQKTLGLQTAALLPYKSYARKNIGYLYAISKGAKKIYETDDDNLSDFHRVFAAKDDDVCSATLVNDGVRDAQNVYAYFGRPDVWPRGFPLENINNTDGNNVLSPAGVTKSYSPIKSYLVNGDPDTDAIFRLTHGEAVGGGGGGGGLCNNCLTHNPPNAVYPPPPSRSARACDERASTGFIKRSTIQTLSTVLFQLVHRSLLRYPTYRRSQVGFARAPRLHAARRHVPVQLASCVVVRGGVLDDARPGRDVAFTYFLKPGNSAVFSLTTNE